MTDFNPFPKPAPRPKKQPKPIPFQSAKRKEKEEREGAKLKVLKPIRKFTAKRQALENEKHKMYASEAEKRKPFCRGCGTTENLSHSHRISQNDRTLIARPENVDYYCQTICHPAFESGKMWLLDNGCEVLEWLAQTNWERYAKKVFKMIDRINEQNLSESDLPEWVICHVLAVTK